MGFLILLPLFTNVICINCIYNIQKTKISQWSKNKNLIIKEIIQNAK